MRTGMAVLAAQQRILLFGGSFNPIHHAHLLIARYAAEALSAARVVLLPASIPPHKQRTRLAPGSARLEMCRRAVAGEPLFEVSDWELSQPGPSYTLHTVRHFAARLGPSAQICWLIGGDSLAELHTWYRVDELVSEARLITAQRPSAPTPLLTELQTLLTPDQIQALLDDTLNIPQIDISATELRRRVQAGQSIRWLTPDAVIALIEDQRLYQPD